MQVREDHFLNESDQMSTKPFFSYQELGQHILCTAPGCSRVHRLEPKKHTSLTLIPLKCIISQCSIVSVTLAQHTSGFLPGMCTMRQLQLSTR